jgi:hypothetical protein
MEHTKRITVEDQPSTRIDAALSHCEAAEVAEQITGHRPSVDHVRYSSFLDGWDHAMESAGKSELLEENRHLHGLIMDAELTTDSVKAAASDMHTALSMLRECETFKLVDPFVRELVMSALEKAALGS